MEFLYYWEAGVRRAREQREEYCELVKNIMVETLYVQAREYTNLT